MGTILWSPKPVLVYSAGQLTDSNWSRSVLVRFSFFGVATFAMAAGGALPLALFFVCRRRSFQ
jgi:hypothetical protein